MTSYTIDQLIEIRNYALEKKLLQSWDNDGISKLIRLLRLRELKLKQPRDRKGRFVKKETNG